MEIKPITRDEHGLIVGVDYPQTPEGLIDWRKMIKPEFLVPNKQIFERAGRTLPTSVEGLEDKELLILLGGIKNLARVRGYSSVGYRVSTAPGYVIAVCYIEWIGNFETEGKPVLFSGIGDASPANTNQMGQKYLGPFAENRSFIRCVRNFLNVNVLGQEEVEPEKEFTSTAPEASAAYLLEQVMREKKVSFEDVKGKLVKENVEGAEQFSSAADIPKLLILDLIKRLKKKS